MVSAIHSGSIVCVTRPDNLPLVFCVEEVIIRSMEIRRKCGVQHYDGATVADVGGQVLAIVEADSLIGANLRGQQLQFSALKGTDLRMGDLSRCRLDGADLRRANLQRANLQGANLLGANLTGADLRIAFMAGANLCGTDLTGVRMDNANVRFVRYDQATVWPAELDTANLKPAPSKPEE